MTIPPPTYLSLLLYKSLYFIFLNVCRLLKFNCCFKVKVALTMLVNNVQLIILNRVHESSYLFLKGNQPWLELQLDHLQDTSSLQERREKMFSNISICVNQFGGLVIPLILPSSSSFIPPRRMGI